MSLEGKNRALFSYNNSKRVGSQFIFKDFEKTKSYHTNFSKSSFKGVSFRGAHLKYCSFVSCTFHDTDFVGTNLRGSNFTGAHFVDCVFVSVAIDKAKFKDATFEHCYFVGTAISPSVLKNNNSEDKIIVLPHYPPHDEFDSELIQQIEKLRANDIIRRSNTLHCKNGKINTLTLMILKEQYSENELIKYLPLLPNYITTQFYTISYLKMILTKIKKSDTI